MKILIVEDEKKLRELMEMYLSGYGSCDFAANGQEAVAAIENSVYSEQPYDLICMDIMMPEMDGIEALKKIRRMEFQLVEQGKPVTKIIMVTAKDMAKDMMSAFQAGCEAYLTKPFTREELIEQIRGLGLIDEPTATE